MERGYLPYCKDFLGLLSVKHILVERLTWTDVQRWHITGTLLLNADDTLR